MRVAIAGVPRAGKTTLAARFPGLSLHTDNLIDLGWSEASEAAAVWFDERDPFVIEGVAVPRALRKWLAAHPEGKPCDRLFWLERPLQELSPGQARMAKGCLTVWHEVRPELERRGVEILYA